MEEGLTTRANGPRDGNAMRALKDIAFGSAAGMVSKVFEHPFDLCKVRLQAQVLDKVQRFNGPIDCLWQTWTKEGIRGLYRGLPAPIVGAMVENAVLFLSNGQLQEVIRSVYGLPKYIRSSDGTLYPSQLSLGHVALAAAGAGSITSFFLTPIELVKCRMQVQMLAAELRTTTTLKGVGALPLSTAAGTIRRPAFRDLQGPFAIISSVLRAEGARGLWLGQTGTFIRETGGAAAWFGANEVVSRFFLSRRAYRHNRPRQQLSKKDLAPWESAIAGAFAGVSYNVVLYPADSVKSAIQTEAELRPSLPGTARTRPTFLGTFRAIYAAQGIKGLYAGLGVTVARSAPSSAMIFLIYDQLTKRFS